MSPKGRRRCARRNRQQAIHRLIRSLHDTVATQGKLISSVEQSAEQNADTEGYQHAGNRTLLDMVGKVIQCLPATGLLHRGS